MAIADIQQRQDIDICYWNIDDDEEISEVTRKRLRLQRQIPRYDYERGCRIYYDENDNEIVE